MSYCNQPASLALREVGFDEPTEKYWMTDTIKTTSSFLGGLPNPFLLQAADWICDNHLIGINFGRSVTEMSWSEGRRPYSTCFGDGFTDDQDHRNAAIIAACEIIKERRDGRE